MDPNQKMDPETAHRQALAAALMAGSAVQPQLADQKLLAALLGTGAKTTFPAATGGPIKTNGVTVHPYAMATRG